MLIPSSVEFGPTHLALMNGLQDCERSTSGSLQFDPLPFAAGVWLTRLSEVDFRQPEIWPLPMWRLCIASSIERSIFLMAYGTEKSIPGRLNFDLPHLALVYGVTGCERLISGSLKFDASHLALVYGPHDEAVDFRQLKI